MKKILFYVGIFAGLQGNLFAIHNLIFRNASDITSGTLDPSRVSPSSFTLQGNAIRLTDLAYSTSILTGNVTSYAPAFATAQSTNGLASGSIFRASIILSTHIVNNTVAGVDIASNSINGYNIATDTITERELADNSVVSANIVDGTIVSADILDGTIVTGDIADGQVQGIDMAANTITQSKIGADVILSTNIATGAVASEDILNETIVSGDILNETILSEDIQDATILNVDIANDVILGGKINTGAELTITSMTVRGTFTSTSPATASIFVSTGLRITGLTSQGTVGTDVSGNLIAGTGGGSGTNSSVSTKTASIIIGTDTIQGVDVVGTTESAFFTAFNNINYKGDVYVKNGNYSVKNITMTNTNGGMNLIFESSANMHNVGNNTLFSATGCTIVGLKLNISDFMNKPAIKVGPGTRLYDTINENIKLGQYGVVGGLYDFGGSSNTVVDHMRNRIFTSTTNGGATTVRPIRYHLKNSTNNFFNNIVDEQVPTTGLGGSISDSQWAIEGSITNLDINNCKFKTVGSFIGGQNLTRLSDSRIRNITIDIYGYNGINDYIDLSGGIISSGTVFDNWGINFHGPADAGDSGSAISRFFQLTGIAASGLTLNNFNLTDSAGDAATIRVTNFLFQSGATYRDTKIINGNFMDITTLRSDAAGSSSRLGYNVYLNNVLQTAGP